MIKTTISVWRNCALGVCTAALLALTAPSAQAQVTAFKQSVAEFASRDSDLADIYRARVFEGIWTGSSQAAQDRRNALLTAMSDAHLHGLPADRFAPESLVLRIQNARTPAELGEMEVALSLAFLDYASTIHSGLLNPRKVVDLIKRDGPEQDRKALLSAFLDAPSPTGFLRDLAPKSPEYARLLRQKFELERQMNAGGWGPRVSAKKLEAGAEGPSVIALRNRLIAMGYLDRSVSGTYDAAMQSAVQRAQEALGLPADGVAGGATLDAINTPIEDRLKSVLVALERERWTNFERGERHVWVNLTDFTARIVDNDIVTFETRAVIGATSSDRQSPEFSDEMETMVINPSWYVPRSIIVNEYLPQLRANPAAVGHIQVVASNGQVVSRGQDFSRFSASTFPYSMRQPPGPSNALGSVKFLFPNEYNIYLHDTPARSLFARQVRAFSHGCIRLNDPHDFAYALLAVQTADPVGFFQTRLRSGNETTVALEEHVPVHIIYRTAFTNVKGEMQFRNDIYGRDARIWDALARQGVVIGAVRG